jgi:hypothetical protein
VCRRDRADEQSIIQDNKGDFITASSIYIPHVSSVATAEVMAMKIWLELANL